jgi:hypothetical protein
MLYVGEVPETLQRFRGVKCLYRPWTFREVAASHESKCRTRYSGYKTNRLVSCSAVVAMFDLRTAKKGELYRPSESRLSAKLVQTFAERGHHVVSVTDTYGRILGFILHYYN